MAGFFFRRKKHADIVIPASVNPCSHQFSLAQNRYSKRLDNSLAEVLTEHTFMQIKTQTEDALNGDVTLASRKAHAWRLKLVGFSFVPVGPGFLAGIPMTAVGASDDDEDLFTAGIVLICFFVAGLISFVYNGIRMLSAVERLKRTGFEALNNDLLPRVSEDNPLLRFKLVGLDKPGKVGTLRISLAEMPVAAVVESSSKEPMATKYTA